MAGWVDSDQWESKVSASFLSVKSRIVLEYSDVRVEVEDRGCGGSGRGSAECGGGGQFIVDARGGAQGGARDCG